MRRSKFVMPLALASLYVIAGCGDPYARGQAASVTPSTSPSVPVVAAERRFFSPLLEFLRGGLTLAQTEDRREALIGECMKGRGWSQFVPAAYVGEEEPNDIQAAITYRSAHASKAVATAGVSDSKRPVGGIDPLSLTDAQRKAFATDYGGDGPDGRPIVGTCTDVAAKQLAAVAPIWDPSIGQIWYSSAVTRVFADAGVVAGYQSWRQCLRQAGIVVADTAIDTANSLGIRPEGIGVPDAQCYADSVAAPRAIVETKLIAELLSTHPELGPVAQAALVSREPGFAMLLRG